MHPEGWGAAVLANSLILVYWNGRQHSCPQYKEERDDGGTGGAENNRVSGSLRRIKGLGFIAQAEDWAFHIY